MLQAVAEELNGEHLMCLVCLLLATLYKQTQHACVQIPEHVGKFAPHVFCQSPTGWDRWNTLWMSSGRTVITSVHVTTEKRQRVLM